MLYCQLDFPGGSDSKESAWNTGDPGLIPGLGGAWQPIPVFLPGEFHGQRSLAGGSSWGSQKSSTWLEWLSTAH